MRNRARLVAAAEEVFRESGATAPLDLVATRAGVGRGTLYRHFPDRAALVAAVYAMRVDALERYAAAQPPERLLEHLVVEIAELQLDAPGLITAVRTARDAAALLADVEARTRALLDAGLAAARAHGRVRPGVTTEDVLLTFAMVEGVIATADAEQVVAATHRAVAITLRGLLLAPGPLPTPTLRLDAD